MKTISYKNVVLDGGYLFDKQELNRKVTINSVYDRFKETGRIDAFKLGYPKNDPIRPHFFWDSDVAKWIEGASYSLFHAPDPELEAKVDEIISDIEKNQQPDGYFNIYFSVVEPEKRWSNRDWHELYCAGHLIEAAIAYAEATGKTKLLNCMERYAELIYRVFVIERSAQFSTPGHEEIELALIKLYRYTGNKTYLDLAAHFINCRGVSEEAHNDENFQSHLPVREQKEAVGHSVRAMYLYTAMASLALETNDKELFDVCKELWKDTTERKMYITGGLGSTSIGESFTTPYDLPNDQAYTETCAGIGLCFFASAMQNVDNDSKYADITERALYNGVLSGLSFSGKEFFYENPLEINLSLHFQNKYGKRRFPAQRRVECFGCSCCPPNINRFLASIGSYIYGLDGNTLYVNQFVSSHMKNETVSAKMVTDYPVGRSLTVSSEGTEKIAIRIPSFCKSFKANAPYEMNKGYAVFENEGNEINIEFDLEAKTVYCDPRVIPNSGKCAFIRGPVVYCAEGLDNCDGELHKYVIPKDPIITETIKNGLVELDINCKKYVDGDVLYSDSVPKTEDTVLHLIPYNFFANRDKTDMRVWFLTEK